MFSLVHHSHRYEAMQALAGRYQSITGAGRYWEFSLLMAGVELSGNGYARAYANTGKAESATWTRSGAVITATTAVSPFLTDGDTVEIESSSDAAATPLGSEVVSNVGALSFDFTGVATGGASGTLTYRPAGFFDIDSTGSDDATAYFLTQALALQFAAASGGAWTFDELRMHAAAAAGAWRFKFKTLNGAAVTIPDGDNLTIPAGTLIVHDSSLEVSE
jgi:hypothetical protein